MGLGVIDGRADLQHHAAAPQPKQTIGLNLVQHGQQLLG